MARKFFSSSIQDLEALFKKQNDSIEFLQALQGELRHRRTRRAAKLLNQVTERLTALKSGISPHEQTSQEFPLFQKYQNQSNSQANTNQPPHAPQPPPAKAPAMIETPRIEARLPLPLITNRPEEVLSAWTALEVLSPPAYVRPEDLAGGDRTRVAALSESALPWKRGEKSRPNQRLYYQIVLGSLKMEPVVERLIEQYGDTRPEKSGARGKAVLAVVMVDPQGRLIDSPVVSIASFGWGVISALSGELTNLAQWPEVEPKLVERIEKLLLGLVRGDKEEEELRHNPISRAMLCTAYQALTRELGLPQEWIEPPVFAIRS